MFDLYCLDIIMNGTYYKVTLFLSTDKASFVLYHCRLKSFFRKYVISSMGAKFSEAVIVNYEVFFYYLPY